MVCGFSEEFDFVIDAFGFDRCFLGRTRFLRRLEFLYYGFPGAVASNDLDLLLGIGKTFLADFYQLHPFLVADDQIFEWQFTRLHLLDNFLEPIHRALKVQLRLARLRFTTHGENGGIKHSFARKKGRLPVGTPRCGVRSAQRADPTSCREINTRASLKLSECSLPNQRKMRVFQLPQRRQLKQTAQTSSPSTSFYSMWDAVARFAKEIRASEFMSDMISRRDAYGSEGVMGALDCATLYGLTRWLRPMVLVESGGFIGMSSAFILKALADEKLATSKLYSIELSEDCEQGALIPEELRSSGGFVPMRGRIEDFLKGDQLPRSIDMFLHDSSHSYQHMLWEFRQFWPRLRDGGLLVSHDVQMNAAFPEFVTKTYAHEKKTGRRDAQRTSHYEWGRWGYLGFAIKKVGS